jgi:hypothetical protein
MFELGFSKAFQRMPFATDPEKVPGQRFKSRAAIDDQAKFARLERSTVGTSQFLCRTATAHAERRRPGEGFSRTAEDISAKFARIRRSVTQTCLMTGVVARRLRVRQKQNTTGGDFGDAISGS